MSSMKPTEEWAAVLARMERRAVYRWQPPAQGRGAYGNVTTWRVTAEIALASSDDRKAKVDLSPGTMLRVEGQTSGRDDSHGPVSWATIKFRVLDGRHAGATVEHPTFDLESWV